LETDRNFEYYGEMACRYDSVVHQGGYALAETIYSGATKLRQADSLAVLDLGIGTGLVSEKFARAGSSVTGIDASQEMLEMCKKKSFAKTLILADLSDGHIPNLSEYFDLVLCVGLIEFVRNIDRFFQSIAKAMKSGGNFVLAVRDISLNPRFTKMEWKGLVIDARAFEDHGLIAIHHHWPTVKEALERCGMLIVREEEVFAYKSPTQHIDTMNRLVFLTYESGCNG
jgi:predicted TPR repeat methyltransferase